MMKQIDGTVKYVSVDVDYLEWAGETIAELKEQNAALTEACKYTLDNLQNYQTNNAVFIAAMEGIKQAVALAEGPGLFRPGTGDTDE